MGRSHPTKMQSGESYRERLAWRVMPCACHTRHLWTVRRIVSEWLMPTGTQSD